MKIQPCFFGVSIVILHLGMASGLAGASPTGDEAMFRGGLQHTGFYAGRGPEKLPGVKWAFRTEGPIFSSPIVSGEALYIGSDDRNLYALEAGTGRLIWKFATKGEVRSTPAVSGETLYFGSYDGNIYAVNAATGKQTWAFQTEGERRFEAKGLHGFRPRTQTIPDTWDCYQSSPAVFKGTVYVGSGDGHLYALDAATGALKWKFKTGDVVHSSPAVFEARVYFGSWDSWLYCLDAATGREVWKFKTGEDDKYHNQIGLQGSPAVAGGVVYASCRDSHVYALDAATGALKWKYYHKGSWVIASPAVAGGRVYYGTSDTFRFNALDAATGALLFTVPAGLYEFSSPAVAGRLVYFGNFKGQLVAVDSATGAAAWEWQTEAGKKNELGVIGADGRVNGKVMFVSDFYEDMILSFNKLMSLGAILSSPAVRDGVVYFGSGDGNVYALQ